ncbi:MAG: WbqC family protein [Bacteroidales bacterium]
MPVLFTTAYFPSVRYMAEAFRSDGIAIEVFETYTKQTCRNHCLIYGPNGKHLLSIPVIRPNGNHTITRDVLISTHHSWQKNHWRSIETAYNNSPFFLYYKDNLASFFNKEYKFLIDLNIDILLVLMKLLQCSKPTRFTGHYEKTPGGVTDLRSVTGSKHDINLASYPPYNQVFTPQHGFLPGLTILDLLFNLGPETSWYLEKFPDLDFSVAQRTT